MAPDGKKDERHEIPTHIKVVAIVAFILATSLVAATMTLAWKGQFKVMQIKNVDLKQLESFGGKLQFTAKYWVLPMIWLITRWQTVVHKRVTSRAIDPLSGNEHVVEEANKILNNSVEQLLMSVISQVSLLSYLTPEQTVTLIPLINGWHVVGRIAFWLGYPKYRTFGVMSTLTPTVTSVGFCLYRFLTADLALF